MKIEEQIQTAKITQRRRIRIREQREQQREVRCNENPNEKYAILLEKRVLLLRMQFDSATTDTLRNNDYDNDNNNYDSVTNNNINTINN